MKVLISAFACEPGTGSENEVGWNWVRGVRRLGHEVWVLTRAVNRPAIERQCRTDDIARSINFIYYDVSSIAGKVDGDKLTVYFYYYLWQYLASQLAKRLHAAERFDLVHHVTYVGIRVPSFMGNLGIPFYLGPLAGGDNVPGTLLRETNFVTRLRHSARSLSNALIRFDPLLRRAFRQADRIFVTSDQTRALLPPRFRNKTSVVMAVGIENAADFAAVGLADNDGAGRRGAATETVDGAFRALFVGRFLGMKGMHLGLRAFARLVQAHGDARLTMVGRGPMEPRWRRLAAELGIADRIDWVPWVDRTELAAIYRGHDVLLFPSLYDSGGMVVLEALQHGLPVVCLKSGGPAVLIDDSCGRSIEIAGASPSEVAARLSQALIELASRPELRRRMQDAARDRCTRFSWEQAVHRVYGATDLLPALDPADGRAPPPQPRKVGAD